MPLTKTGKKVLRGMHKTYGSDKKAKQVFYASVNAKKPGAEKWESLVVGIVNNLLEGDDKKVKDSHRNDDNDESRCPSCGGEMKWCESCEQWSKTCCNDYGTCMCS